MITVAGANNFRMKQMERKNRRIWTDQRECLLDCEWVCISTFVTCSVNQLFVGGWVDIKKSRKVEKKATC